MRRYPLVFGKKGKVRQDFFRSWKSISGYKVLNFCQQIFSNVFYFFIFFLFFLSFFTGDLIQMLSIYWIYWTGTIEHCYANLTFTNVFSMWSETSISLICVSHYPLTCLYFYLWFFYSPYGCWNFSQCTTTFCYWLQSLITYDYFVCGVESRRLQKLDSCRKRRDFVFRNK